MIDLKVIEQPYQLLKATKQPRPSSRALRTRQLQRLLLVDIVDQMIDQQCAVVAYSTYARACVKKDVVKQRNGIVARTVRAECVSVAKEALAELKHEQKVRNSVETIPEPMALPPSSHPAQVEKTNHPELELEAEPGQSEDPFQGMLLALITDTVRESCIEVAKANQA